MTVGIYKITNMTNGKCYIGQSIDIERRWRDHHSQYKREALSGFRLCQAFKKYGLQSFSFEILEECEESMLDELEIMYIAKFQSYQNGYNMTLGGGGLGRPLSEEARRKISERQKGRPLSEEWKQNVSAALKGRKFSEKHKRNISEGRKGVVFSEEHKQNLRASHLGHKQSAESNQKRSESLKRALATPEAKARMSAARKGKPRPEEVRQKISAGHKGKTLSMEHRKKLSKAQTGKSRKHSEETLQKIRESQKGPRGQREKSVRCNGVIYPTVKQCAAELGVSASTLSRWLHGVNTPKDDMFKDLSFVNLANIQNDAMGERPEALVD